MRMYVLVCVSELKNGSDNMNQEQNMNHEQKEQQYEIIEVFSDLNWEITQILLDLLCNEQMK